MRWHFHLVTISAWMYLRGDCNTGHPERIWSENCLNFIDGNNELKLFAKMWQSTNFREKRPQNNYSCTFNLAVTPYFGSSWQHGVNLWHFVNGQRFTDEFLFTILCLTELTLIFRSACWKYRSFILRRSCLENSSTYEQLSAIAKSIHYFNIVVKVAQRTSTTYRKWLE